MLGPSRTDIDRERGNISRANSPASLQETHSACREVLQILRRHRPVPDASDSLRGQIADGPLSLLLIPIADGLQSARNGHLNTARGPTIRPRRMAVYRLLLPALHFTVISIPCPTGSSAVCKSPLALIASRRARAFGRAPSGEIMLSVQTTASSERLG